MAQDSQGNDINAVPVPKGGAISFAPYAPENFLKPEDIGIKVAAVKLPDAYFKGGLMKQDGGPADESGKGDSTEFFQEGYSLSKSPDLTTAVSLAEDNANTRLLCYGTEPDENGVYHVDTLTPDRKWCAYYEEPRKNGTVYRRAGIVQVTENKPDQAERGTVKGKAVTFTWQRDPAYGGDAWIDCVYGEKTDAPSQPSTPTNTGAGSD